MNSPITCKRYGIIRTLLCLFGRSWFGRSKWFWLTNDRQEVVKGTRLKTDIIFAILFGAKITHFTFKAKLIFLKQ